MLFYTQVLAAVSSFDTAVNYVYCIAVLFYFSCPAACCVLSQYLAICHVEPPMAFTLLPCCRLLALLPIAFTRVR